MTDINQLIRNGRELLEKATPGPWRVGEAHAHDRFLNVDEYGIAWVGTGCDLPVAKGYNFEVRERKGAHDGSLIAWMHSHIPLLLDALEAAQTENHLLRRVADAARKALRLKGGGSSSVMLEAALAALSASTEGETK